MKKLIYLSSLLLLLLSSCEEHEFKVLEGTSWQITDYTIDGADSMATIMAFQLDGQFYFGERGGSASSPDLIVTTSGSSSGYYNYEGFWGVIQGGLLELALIQGYLHTEKLSFKPFKSRWTIRKLTKRDMQLELTQDNRKYYLRFKPYKQ